MNVHSLSLASHDSSVAAAAAHPAAGTRGHAVCAGGRIRGAVFRWPAKNRKLKSTSLARALRAGDLGALGKHDLLVSCAAIVAKVFVYGHIRFPAPYVT